MVHGIHVQDASKTGCEWNGDYVGIYNGIVNFLIRKDCSDLVIRDPVFVLREDYAKVDGCIRFLEKECGGSFGKINILIVEDLVAAVSSKLKAYLASIGRQIGETFFSSAIVFCFG